MDQSEQAAGGLRTSELVLLRVTLMRHAFAGCRTLADLANLAGLALEDTEDAAANLARIGLVTWRRDDDRTSVLPELAHELWPAVAARVSATAIHWPESDAHDGRIDRSEIEQRTQRDWTYLREHRAEGFEDELGSDGRLAASVLFRGICGFVDAYWWSRTLLASARVLGSDAWRAGARCFAPESLRWTIGMSLADERTLPGVPPMVIADRQRAYCGVCFVPADPGEGRHASELDPQLGSGLRTRSFAGGSGRDPVYPGCGVVWTHSTVRAWLAEILGWIGPAGEVVERMELRGTRHLTWLDP